MQKIDLERITAEIDARHAHSKEAFQAKDINRYMSIFSLDLAYKKADGKVIDHSQLKKNVASQLVMMHRMESSFVRESIEGDGDSVVESLTQSALFETRVFFFFKRRWQIHRRGRYLWTNTGSNRNAGWVISSVDIIEERIS